LRRSFERYRNGRRVRSNQHLPEEVVPSLRGAGKVPELHCRRLSLRWDIPAEIDFPAGGR
jgi:hypothetical protein